MLKKGSALLLLTTALVMAFGLGVARLFQLRFEAGDVYPPYSSLRADPLGTRAFYESLENVGGLTVERFIRQLDELREGRDATLFVLGGSVVQMNESTAEEYTKLEHFMSDGGRIVVSFAPLNTKPWATRRKEIKEKKRAKDGQSREKEQKADEPDPSASRPRRQPLRDDEDRDGEKMISLKDRWNVSLGYEDLPKDSDGAYQSVTARKTGDLELPESILWHTALYFEKPGTNWNVIYSRDAHPVVIERKFGRGGLVFSADSYFLSNEGLRKARHPQLLAWVVGPNRHVLFDETHLGVMETPGVAGLVRKYRLHGLVIGLALLAGLFVWKNSVSFVPASAETDLENREDAVAGKDSFAGFVNLLRRGVPPAEILPLCFAEWKKARMPNRFDSNARLERAASVIAGEQSVPARHRNPVEAYRRISRILSERSDFKSPGSRSKSPDRQREP